MIGGRNATVLTGQDRRRFPRMRTAWPVILEATDGRVGVGQVIDVSLTGLRISTELEIEPDTPLMLRVTLPKDTGRLEVLVKVARRDPRGFGVSFLTLGEGEAARISPRSLAADSPASTCSVLRRSLSDWSVATSARRSGCRRHPPPPVAGLGGLHRRSRGRLCQPGPRRIPEAPGLPRPLRLASALHGQGKSG